MLKCLENLFLKIAHVVKSSPNRLKTAPDVHHFISLLKPGKEVRGEKGKEESFWIWGNYLRGSSSV